MTFIRPFAPHDAETCRRLWEELTEWHRQIFDSPEIGGEDPGRAFDQHLAQIGPESVWVAVFEGQMVGLVGLIPGTEPELEPIVVAAHHRHRGSAGGLPLLSSLRLPRRGRGSGRARPGG